MVRSSNKSLRQEADDFAERIDRTISLIVANNPGTSSRPIESGGGFLIQLNSPLGLSQNGTTTMRMHLRFACTWSLDTQYLAIEDSRIAIQKVDGGVPLVAFDYLRQPRSVPSAHINFSGMNTEFTSVLPKQRQSRDGNHVGLTGSKVHLPVGGHRFRPILEDVFEMLIRDFQIDHFNDTSWDAIREGRREFRLRQVAAASKDAPDVACEALLELDDKALPRTDRLETY